MYKKRSELFDCNFVYFLILSMFVVVRIISSTFEIDTVMSYVLNLIIQVPLALCLPVFLFSFLRKQKVKKTLSYYGFKKTSIKAILISLAIGVFVYILTIFISSFFSTIISLLGYESIGTVAEIPEYPVWLLIIELITTAVLPGICEEVANRGMLLNCYKRLGSKKAILLSGLFFGLMHLNINQFFYATIIGFYLGFVAILCDNIWPVIIIHFTNNALSTFMSFASANNLWVYRWVEKMFEMVLSSGAVSGIFVLFIFVSFVCIVMFWLTKKLCKETRVRHLTQVADQMLRTQLRNDLMKDVEDAEVQPIQNDTGIQLTQQTIGGRTVFNIDFSKEIVAYKPYVPNKKENIFMYANLFLGIVVTIFTFIWGIL